MIENFSTPLLILTALTAATIVGVWISLIIWTARDVQLRSKDKLAIFLSVISVVVLTFPGFLIYLILRPKQTIEQTYQTTLEEEALLESIELKNRCQTCGNPISKDWKFCPFCESLLKTICTSCSFLLEPNWKICPNCGEKQHSKHESIHKIEKEESEIIDSEIEKLPPQPPDDSDKLIEENDFDTL